jgi:nitrate reductase gamma subunit
MEQWLEWARGPFFRFSFLVMILGLLREVILTVVGIVRVMREAGDPDLPLKKVFIATLKWVFPVRAFEDRTIYSLTSVIFHIGIIITPIFLLPHIVLWERGIGISWPAIPHIAADVLTLITIAATIGLIIGRVFDPNSRALSRLQDYLIPPLILIPFVTGYLHMHPWVNPFNHNAVMLIHVMSANVIFLLIPFTKMSHCILLPFTQLVSEAGWHFPADSGEAVAHALHKEREPV